MELQHLTQGAPEQLSQFRDTIIIHTAYVLDQQSGFGLE